MYVQIILYPRGVKKKDPATFAAGSYSIIMKPEYYNLVNLA